MQAKHVEIMDSENRVRVEIGVANQSGRDVSQMIFRDERGNIASLLTLNTLGNGTLYFSGNGTEGKVAVGYLWGSDSKPTGEDDPLGAWGIRILGRDGLQTAIGVSESGAVIAPKASSGAWPHTR